MKKRVARKIAKRLILSLLLLMVLFFSGIFLLARFYVEPALRQRLQTLIVEGSDSLYTYRLGDMSTNVFGGNIWINDFEMSVDSTRYRQLQGEKALPALVARVSIKRASLEGLSIFALLFSKKIYISKIHSGDADVNLLRNFQKRDTSTAVTRNKQPLWKLLQSKIKDLKIDKIQLDGIRLLYQNSEDVDAARLQFERCDALFEDIHVDSASVADTSRLQYVANFSLGLRNLSYRTPDSLYQMKAATIAYNSKQRSLQVDSFGLQPTLDKNQRIDSMRKSWYTVLFDKVQFHNLRLDRYLRLNRAEADSVVFGSPRLSIFQDKLGLKSYVSKIGKYPHQQLLNAAAIVDIKKFAAHNMQIEIIEKDDITRLEGRLPLTGLELTVENIVNDTALIRRNPIATATASGKIIGSPVQASFRFYLDSAEGRFDANGRLQNMTAAQINPLSSALANVQVPSATINDLVFFVRGHDYGATADVQMQYSNLSVVFLKRDKETGANTSRNFLNKLLNKYAIYTSNPIGGTERKAYGVKVARLTTQSFFGVIWQAVFAGMQDIILKSG